MSALLREGLVLRRQTVGEKHWQTAAAQSSMGAWLARQGKRDEGPVEERRAVDEARVSP